MARKEQDKPRLSPRELRKKRRIRNQILSFVLLSGLLIVLIVGVFFAGRHLSQKYLKTAKEEAALSGETTETASETDDSGETDTAIETYTASDQLEDMVDACIEAMSEEDRIAGLLITTPEGLTGVAKVTKAGNGTKKALADMAVGGIVYHPENVLTEDQFSSMLTETISNSKYPLFFAMDGESDKLQGDLSTVGINVEFAEHFEDETSVGFRIVTLPSLLNGEPEDGPVTAQLSGEGDALADACIEAWKNGADMIYLPEHFVDAYPTIIARAEETPEIADRLAESLKKVYRIKCRASVE
ncbi:MAG: hypothetical protein K5641_03330 [Lachnospiraceae bacterium]|nr:hypothetical protein [Lachnospiraceae bacterium]